MAWARDDFSAINPSPTQIQTSYQFIAEQSVRYIASIDGQKYEIEIEYEDLVLVQGRRHSIDFRSIAHQPLYSLLIDGHSYEALAQINNGEIEIHLQGQQYLVKIEDERQHRLRERTESPLTIVGEFHLKSPMPGLIIEVCIAEGQKIQPGERLIVLESMKMQNEIRAPQEGSVKNIRVAVGDRVEQYQILLVIG